MWTQRCYRTLIKETTDRLSRQLIDPDLYYSSSDLSPFLLDLDLDSDLEVLPARPFFKSFVPTKTIA